MRDCIRATPKIITGKLAPARYVPNAATFVGTQDHIGRRCIAGSGFDIRSDLFLAIVTAIKTKKPTRPGDKIGDTTCPSVPETDALHVGDCIDVVRHFYRADLDQSNAATKAQRLEPNGHCVNLAG